MGLPDMSFRPVTSRPGIWYPLSLLAEELRLLCADFNEEMGGGGGMAILLLRVAADDLVRGGGGGTLDRVCALAIEGTLTAMSENTKNWRMIFMVGEQPHIHNRTRPNCERQLTDPRECSIGGSWPVRTAQGDFYDPSSRWSFQGLRPNHVVFDQSGRKFLFVVGGQGKLPPPRGVRLEVAFVDLIPTKLFTDTAPRQTTVLRA